MKDVWFTADLHMGHRQEFLYGPRGFANEIEMNEAIVERWNELVKPGDVVYNLGDMAMNDIEASIPYLKQLNGHQIWIMGNHDTDKKAERILYACHSNIYMMKGNTYSAMLKDGKMRYYVSHYPTITTNFDDKHFSQHVFSFHGHTHQKTNFYHPDNPFLYHVGMDSHDCRPVHLDEVLTDIRNRWNALGKNTPKLIMPNDYGIPKGE